MLIRTPFGQLACEADANLAAQFSVQVAPVTPRLPSGMTLQGCLGILWRVTADHAVPASAITCAWVDRADPGSPESGEGVDILTWERGACAIALGTSDMGAIRAHAGVAVSTSIADATNELVPVEYIAAGLRVRMAPLAAGESASGHFLLAWTERANALSAWYAVDWSHAALRAAVESATHSSLDSA